jgi:uncharacterized membrane protein YsdA (DUF1294 family)
MFKTIILGYLAWVMVMSLVTFVVYGWDKRQAKMGGRRVPENRLHGLAFLGGWPGAMLGQRYFRHKTHKAWFQFRTWGAAIVHAIAVSLFFYFELS